MDRKLLCEIVQRIECVAGIEAFLVLTVAALHLTVVPRSIRANQLMPDAQLSSRPLKQRRQLALPAGEAVGKLETVVRLDTLHFYASAGVPRPQPAQEVRRGIGGLLRVGRQETQPRELVDGGVLEQAKLRIRDTAAGNDLDIHLHTLAGIGYLLVRLWLVRIFGLVGRKQAHFAHNAEQALRTAGVAALPQTVPQFDHSQRRIAAAYIADELQSCVHDLQRSRYKPTWSVSDIPWHETSSVCWKSAGISLYRDGAL